MIAYDGKPGSQGNYDIPCTCGKCYGKYYVSSQIISQPVRCPHCGWTN